MNLSFSLLIYLFVTILVTVTLTRWHIHIRSSIIVGLLIGQVILNFLVPPTELNIWNGESTTSITFSSSVAFYLVIQLLTPFIVAIYSFVMAIKDSNIRKI